MTSLTRNLLALALGTALLGAGCGEVLLDSDGGVDGDGGNGTEIDAMPPGPCDGDSIELEDLFDCVRLLACDLFGPCVFGAPIKYCEHVDIQILEDHPAAFSAEVLANAVAAGRVTYDGAAAASCLADLRALSCAEFLTAPDEDPFVACGIVTGTIADGDDCNLTSECATVGARCRTENRDEVCESGTCVPPVPVGGDCSGGGRCVSGAICHVGTCRTGLAGSPCQFSNHCRHDFWCNDTVCAADFASNASCTDNSQCTYPDLCVGLSLPDSDAGTCGRTDREGDSCDGRGRCGPGLWCDQTADPDALGTCKPLPLAGEPCTATDECRFDARCNASSQCVAKGDPNATCSNTGNDCHFALYCSNELNDDASGICLAPAGTGSACNYREHCQSGFCDGDTNQCVEVSCEDW